jgi:hypothetical protein
MIMGGGDRGESRVRSSGKREANKADDARKIQLQRNNNFANEGALIARIGILGKLLDGNLRVGIKFFAQENFTKGTPAKRADLFVVRKVLEGLPKSDPHLKKNGTETDRPDRV